MTDLKDQIANLIQEREDAAYRRGWDDAVAAMLKAATPPSVGFQTQVATEPPRRTGRPTSSTPTVVENCINLEPGMKGVDVVNAVHNIDPLIPERTVRTALRRLKIHKRIWQREGRWYPKPSRQRSLLENDDQEAISSPPHQ